MRGGGALNARSAGKPGPYAPMCTQHCSSDTFRPPSHTTRYVAIYSTLQASLDAPRPAEMIPSTTQLDWRDHPGARPKAENPGILVVDDRSKGLWRSW